MLVFKVSLNVEKFNTDHIHIISRQL